MRISDWSSDVCSSDLEAWRTGRTPRTISGEPAEVAPTGPAMSPRPRAAQGPEAGERNATMLQCASGKLTEAGRPKPATIVVEWPPDVAEAENRFSTSIDAPNTRVNPTRCHDDRELALIRLPHRLQIGR